MKVMKTMVILGDDEGNGGAIHSMDTIEFDGKLWLVPEWLDNQDAKISMPVRIVCLSLIPHEATDAPDRQFVVSGPVPKSVFEGHCPQRLKAQYLVVERPDIRVPFPTEH